MEVASQRHLARLSRGVSALAKLVAKVNSGIASTQFAELEHISSDAEAIASITGLQAASAEHLESIAARASEVASMASTGHKASLADANKDPVSLTSTGDKKPQPWVYLRAEDVKPDLDVFRYKLLEVRSDLDFLRSSLQQKDSACSILTQEVSQLRTELGQIRATETSQEDRLAVLLKEHRLSKLELHDLQDRMMSLSSKVVKGCEEADQTLAKVVEEGQVLCNYVEASRAVLAGKTAELEGYIRSMDDDQSKALRDLAGWREDVKLELQALAEVDVQAFDERVQLRSQVQEHQALTTKSVQSLQDSMKTEVKLQAEKQGKACAELSRLIRGQEKKQTTALKEQEEVLKRLLAVGLDSERQTREVMLEALQQNFQQSQEETRAALARVTDEFNLMVSEVSERLTTKVEVFETETRRQHDDHLVKVSARSAEVANATKALEFSLSIALNEKFAEAARISQQVLSQSEDKVRTMAFEVRNEAQSQLDRLDAKYSQGLQAVRSDIQQSLAVNKNEGAETVRELRSEIRALAVELGGRSVHDLSRLREEMVEKVNALKMDLERSFSGLQLGLKETRGELLQLVESQAQTLRQSSVAQGLQSCSEVASLRSDVEALTAEVSRLARGGCHQDERLEARLSDLRGEVGAALRTQAEQVKGLREGILGELRGSLIQVESRLQRRVDMDTERVNGVDRAVAGLPAELGITSPGSRPFSPNLRGEAHREPSLLDEEAPIHVGAFGVSAMAQRYEVRKAAGQVHSEYEGGFDSCHSPASSHSTSLQSPALSQPPVTSSGRSQPHVRPMPNLRSESPDQKVQPSTRSQHQRSGLSTHQNKQNHLAQEPARQPPRLNTAMPIRSPGRVDDRQFVPNFTPKPHTAPQEHGVQSVIQCSKELAVSGHEISHQQIHQSAKQATVHTQPKQSLPPRPSSAPSARVKAESPQQLNTIASSQLPLSHEADDWQEIGFQAEAQHPCTASTRRPPGIPPTSESPLQRRLQLSGSSWVQQ